MNFLIFLAAVPPIDVGDAWDLAVDAQLRPRLVAHSGRDFKSSDLVDQLYVSQRARLGVSFRHEDGAALTLRLQDVRFWGEEANTMDATADGLDMLEANVQLPLLDHVSATVGRQQISWDQQRLIGAVNWSQRGRAFDAIRLRYKDDALDAEVIASPLMTSANSHGPLGDPDGHVDPARSQDTWLTGLHAAATVAEGLTLTGVYLFRRDGSLEEKRHTAGGLLAYGVGGFSSTAEGYYQLGDLGEESIGAWMGGLRIAYALDAVIKPKLTLIADMLSGDGKPTGVFDTLYGTNHGYYGEMDFFTNIPLHTQNLGLVNFGGVISLEPTEGVVFKAAFHGFQSMEPGPGDDTAFGQEVDLNLDWQINPQVTFSGLVAFFLPGDAWESVRGPSDPSPEEALYITLDYKP